MENETRFSRVMSVIILFVVITVVVFGFLSLVNWNLNIGEWNGFSRFLLGVVGVGFLFKVFEEL
jgi:hypothetical protein